MIFYLHECEEKLGYTFSDKNLLRQCFTHSSYTNENKNAKNNERLEFFGDSVLGFIVAEYLLSKEKDCDEGKLTSLKQQLVSRKPLSDAVAKYGFDKFILYGEGEKNNHTGTREATDENLFEAIVAGIYLDGGLEAAKKFIFSHLISVTEIDEENIKRITVDNKSKLQEFVQKNKLGKLSYKQTGKDGPDHEPTFTIALYLDDEKLSEEKGKTKSQAEKACAAKALCILQKRGKTK